LKVVSQRLVLWDIDGTILHGGGLWSRCFMESFQEYFDLREAVKIPFSGKTDRQICRELMQAAGHWDEGVAPGACSRHEGHIDAVLRGYLDRARERAGSGGVRVLPGVPELVGELARLGVTQGLLTGNVREGAWLKLGTAGLREAFGFRDALAWEPGHAREVVGAFGDDHWDRYELPRIAVAEARRRLGREFSGKQVVILGDTIHDVGCGQSLGVRAIGVGTGQPDARARVHAAWRGEPLCAGDPQADHFFEDLSDVGAVVRAIVGE
jgi:phosphoglycolate phosphatase-like HAD superfamily hydrolase